MRSKSGPGGTLYHYGLCEVAKRQAVLLRKDKPSDRAIKSDRAKVVMTAGCISRNFDISNYIYNFRKRGNSINQNLCVVKKYRPIQIEPADKNFLYDNTRVLTQKPCHPVPKRYHLDASA